MLDGLELFGMGYSWGGYESLILPVDPRALAHRAAPGRTPGPLLRLHAGLEDPDDLIADLERGLRAPAGGGMSARRHAPPRSTRWCARSPSTRDGLVPAIAQQHDTGEVLMLAWMNREAWPRRCAPAASATGRARARRLWRKGETSGQVQRLVELRLDCDGDTLLLLVDQTGVACHTGRRSCFFRTLQDGTLTEDPPAA